MNSRTIAIGDIHGCDVAFAALLDAVRPASDDRVVVLGDFVDRGPNSKGVMDRLLRMQEECRLVVLRGNHEQMLLAAAEGVDPQALSAWLQSGGVATLDSYGQGVGPRDLPAAHLKLMREALDFYEIDDHIFVHANYEANAPIDQQLDYHIRWESLRDRIPPRHVSGKTIVVGHTPQIEGEILDRGYLKCIDTGCCRGGWLTALETGSGHIWQTNQEGQLREMD